jgi:hypothetical protein
VGLPIVLPKCRQPYGWSCRLESAARSTVMSQDTGMAMTLIGDKGFTRRYPGPRWHQPPPCSPVPGCPALPRARSIEIILSSVASARCLLELVGLLAV